MRDEHFEREFIFVVPCVVVCAWSTQHHNKPTKTPNTWALTPRREKPLQRVQVASKTSKQKRSSKPSSSLILLTNALLPSPSRNQGYVISSPQNGLLGIVVNTCNNINTRITPQQHPHATIRKHAHKTHAIKHTQSNTRIPTLIAHAHTTRRPRSTPCADHAQHTTRNNKYT